MNIKAIINRLFNSKSNVSSIINLGDIIQIPKRNDIKDQQLLLNIDKYKKEYLDILNTKGYLLPNMLSSKEIQDEMKINIDLIVKLYLEDAETTNDKIPLITKYLRLKLYLDKVSELGNIVLARLIALKEIFNEKIIISKHKRQRISYEINNLLSILVTFNSQKYALENEYNLYHERLVSSNIDLNLTDEELSEVNKKLEDVCELVKSVMPNINTNDYQGISGLVALERMLEIYVSKNANNAPKIKADFDDFRIHTFCQQYEDVIKLLRRFEIQYRVFNEYGRNLITDDDLLELYKLKFKTLTHKFYRNDYDIELVNEKTTNKEYECYKLIVSEIIEDIVKGKNIFNEMTYTFDSDNNYSFKRKAIKLMIKVLKNKKDYFDIDHILQDQFLFLLLLAFKNTKYLNDFFKNYKIPYSLCYLDNHLEWDDNLSLSTIFRLDKVCLNMDKPRSILYDIFGNADSKMLYLKELYFLHYSNQNDLLTARNQHEINFMHAYGIELYLPEGLKSINAHAYDIYYPFSICGNLMRNAENSIVVFPNSLKKVGGYIFNYKSVKEIRLNDGLKELDMKIFDSQLSESIIIPSSVSKINYDAKLYLTNDTLCFNDFRESKILNKDKNLMSLFNSFFVISCGGAVGFKLSEIKLLYKKGEKLVSFYIDLKSIEKSVYEELNKKGYCSPQKILNIIIKTFKEEVYKQTGFMLGCHNDELLEESEEKVLTKK